jgi:hypothetical protein
VSERLLLVTIGGRWRGTVLRAVNVAGPRGLVSWPFDRLGVTALGWRRRWAATTFVGLPAVALETRVVGEGRRPSRPLGCRALERRRCRVSALDDQVRRSLRTLAPTDEGQATTAERRVLKLFKRHLVFDGERSVDCRSRANGVRQASPRGSARGRCRWRRGSRLPASRRRR